MGIPLDLTLIVLHETKSPFTTSNTFIQLCQARTMDSSRRAILDSLVPRAIVPMPSGGILQLKKLPAQTAILLMAEILHQFIGSLSHLISFNRVSCIPGGARLQPSNVVIACNYSSIDETRWKTVSWHSGPPQKKPTVLNWWGVEVSEMAVLLLHR